MRTVFGSTVAAPLQPLLVAVMAAVMAIAFQFAAIDAADAKKRKRANPKYAGLVMDAKTGKVLYSSNANARRYPASLTKMMTLYLVFEDLKAGRISMKTRVPMTREGTRRPPSKLGLRVGQSVSVNQAILALVTKSANDVAAAVGGKLSGSEAAFARRMTKKARALGMSRTTFKNASGLTAQGQVTTAKDMATLGLALREHFPNRYKVFQTRLFKFGKRRYGNHNKLLGKVRGVDGIKTGYTRASGFNLVSSVRHNGRSIVAVVMGGRSGASRNAHMKDLIRRYLPKASRTSRQRQLVAKATGARKSYALRGSVRSLAKLDTLPKPDFAPRTEKKVIALAKPVKASTAAAIVPSTRDGWHIQLAAGTDKDELKVLLERVQAKNPSLLGEAQIHMPQASGGRRPIYRARFAGFGSKTKARSACKALKRQRVDCLAIAG